MLNPMLLWLLPVALLPIALHLLARRRPKPIDFPTVRFLMETRAQHRARNRLVELLLLLLRILVIAAVIVALGRPLLSTLGPLSGLLGASALAGGGQRDVVVILDAGAAMAEQGQTPSANWSLQTASAAPAPSTPATNGATEADRAPAPTPGTPWARAVDAAGRIIRGLGPGDHLTLIHAGQTATPVYRGYVRDTQTPLEKLDRLAPQRRPARLVAALDLAARSKPVGVRSIYLISGGEAAAWAGVADSPALAQLDPSTRINLVAIDTADRPSTLRLALDWPDDLPTTRGLPRRVRLTVTNPDPAALTERLRLRLNDQTLEDRTVSVGGQSQRTFTFTLRPTDTSVQTGVVWLGAGAPETSTAAWFYLRPHALPRVLVVSGSTTRRGADDPALYVTAALRSAFQPAGAGDAADLTPSATVARRSTHELAGVDLSAFGCVVLVDTAWPTGMATALQEYVRGGGGVMILPGAQIGDEQLDRTLLALLPRAPRLWSAARGDPDDESSFARLEVIRPDHAVMRAFDSLEDEPLASVRVYRWRAVREPTSGGLARWTPLVRVPGGDDVLALAELGRGRVVFSGMSGGPIGSDLPLKPSFVPLLSRLSVWAAAGGVSRVPPSVGVGEPIALTLAGIDKLKQLQVRLPDGAVRPVESRRVLDQAVARFGPTRQVGRHTFIAQTGGAMDQEFHVAVNAAGPASVQEVLTPAQQLAALKQGGQATAGGAQVRRVDPQAAGDARQAGASEVWRWLIALVLGFMVVEVLLSTGRGPGGTQGRGGSADEGAGAGAQTGLSRAA